MYFTLKLPFHIKIMTSFGARICEVVILQWSSCNSFIHIHEQETDSESKGLDLTSDIDSNPHDCEVRAAKKKVITDASARIKKEPSYALYKIYSIYKV